jgi:hypothetical protein
MVGMGLAGVGFRGIMPGSKQDIKNSPLIMITSFGIYPLGFINHLLCRIPQK